MTDELKPCPFCGGAWGIVRDEPIPGAGFVECIECGARGGISRPDEAVRLWNARVERTCRIVEYDEAPFPVCSECGAVQPDDFTVYYCWNCGAKVVDE